MKRIAILFVMLIAFCGVRAQDVLTVVFATSDDGFVNVRKNPSTKSAVLSKVWALHHGMGNGVLRGHKGNWSYVSVDNVYGWAYTKYLGTMTWFTGTEPRQLIAGRERTTIYTDDYRDGTSDRFFTTVKKGTVLADNFDENDEYYVLTTAHDNLYIRKSDAFVVNVNE